MNLKKLTNIAEFLKVIYYKLFHIILNFYGYLAKGEKRLATHLLAGLNIILQQLILNVKSLNLFPHLELFFKQIEGDIPKSRII